MKHEATDQVGKCAISKWSWVLAIVLTGKSVQVRRDDFRNISAETLVTRVGQTLEVVEHDNTTTYRASLEQYYTIGYDTDHTLNNGC